LGRALSPYEKVALANECQAHVFISLRHTAGSDTSASGPSVGRYYLGGEGARLAGLVAEELKAVSGLAVRDIADFSYVVMQTGCPAVIINTPAGLPTTAARCGKEAYAVFSALLRFYAGADSAFSREYRGTALDHRTGKPAAEAVIVLDNFLTVPVERDGKYLLRCLQPGEHVLRVMAGKNCLKEEKIAVP
jgi:hypothetical protein